MRKRMWLGLWIPVALWVAISWGQTGTPPKQGLLPPEAYLTSRESNLETQLRRLKEAEAGMGENHPSLADVRKRIADVVVELETFRTIPNPFKQFEEQGATPTDIVDRLSEKELRILVVRLALDVKDLRTRVADLERFNPSR